MLGQVFLRRYQLIRLLGAGSMGRAYLARQLDQDRETVVKVMHDHVADTPRFRDGFQREMALMARFQHPHVVQLHDAGVDDQHGPCIVMEYLPGATLETLRAHNPRSSPERVGRWLGQLCSALQAAHATGIVHRDLKPANLMLLEPDTSAERIKVMDFGLAQLATAPHIALEKLNGTCNHIGGGTPEYLPPEQVRRDEVDHRGDLYSVGVLLFELLTGRHPFADVEDTADLLLAHARKTPPRFADLGSADLVPPAVEAVVQACLAKYPNERPQNARELAERYEHALGLPLLHDIEFVTPTPSSPAPAPAAAVVTGDALTVVHHLEAWMPESIAVVKLRGFAEDNGGEVVESVPGLIRLRFRDPGAAPAERGGLLSWLGFGSQPKAGSSPRTCMELHLQKKQTDQRNLLQVTVRLCPEDDNPARARDPDWRSLCDQRYHALRSYLMGRA